MIEQRQVPRHKSFLRGIVSFSDTNCTLDCTIRDISQTGMRLKFDSTPPIIAEYLDLNIPIKGKTYRGRVVWSKGNEIGITLENNIGVIASRAGDTTDTSDSSEEELSIRVSRLEAEINSLKQIIKHLKNGAEKPDAA
jgi:PilZ domain